MTKIELAEDRDEFSILCQGHAGYADIGNDIVCAAISALIQSLIKYLVDSNIENCYKITPGFAWIYGKDCKQAYDVIRTGLELIEANYPQHVEIIKGCTIFWDSTCD